MVIAAENIEEIVKLMDNLAGLNGPQFELILLQSCNGACKLLHVPRCPLSAVEGAGVEAFDSALHAAPWRIVVGPGNFILEGLN